MDVMEMKEILKDGYTKSQLVLVEQRDANDKIHFIAVDNMEIAKRYFGSAQKRQVTYLTK